MLRKAALFVLITVVACFVAVVEAGPKGAKAIFDSGEGTTVGMSLKPQKKAETAVVQAEKYMGISYQLVLLSDDGQFRVVPKSRSFKTGERLKMLVRTNRPGYLTIVNVGSSGNTNVLFSEYVEAYQTHEIPRSSNFRFVGAPGTEKVLLMLSQRPLVGTGGESVMAAGGPPPEPGQAGGYRDSADLPPPPPVDTLVANYEGSKGIPGGAKDIAVEDGMQNSYSVISPKNGWKPARRGGKDIVVESSAGTNYGVIPSSYVSDGGILTLEVKLRHR